MISFEIQKGVSFPTSQFKVQRILNKHANEMAEKGESVIRNS